VHDSMIIPNVGAANRVDGEAMFRLCLVGAAVAVLTLATPAAFRAGGDYAYMAMAIAVGLLAVAASRIADRTSTVTALWLIVTIAVVLRGVLLFTEPLLSSDIYRYVWDGKVAAAGINPYRYLPSDDALSGLRDAAIYPNINRPNYAVTIYPPVAQVFFFLATRLGENVTAMKLALLACEAVTATCIALLLRRLERPVTRLVAYLWHPLPLWEIANSGHIDALMVALMMLGLWFAVTGSPHKGAIAITLGALAKPFAVLAMPAAWRPWDWKVPLIAACVIAVCYAPYLSVGWGVFGYLTTGYLSEEQYATGGGIWLLSLWRLLVGSLPGDVFVYLVAASAILAALGFKAAQRLPRTAEGSLVDINRLVLTFLLLLSPNYPWYFLIATPFVALVGGAPVWTLTIAAVVLQDESRMGIYLPLLPRKTLLFSAFLCAWAYAGWRAWQRNAYAKEPP